MLSRGWTGKLAATFLVIILGVAALPSSYAEFALDDVRRPIYRGNVRTRDLKSDTEVIVKSDISVGGVEDGRAVSSTPTTVTPIGESLKMVTKQLLQAPSATDMVATDVRTPPRVKTQHDTQKINADVFVPLGKGEATPIVMEDHHPSSYEIVTSPTPKSSTHSPDGISTWILLSNGEQTTAANKKKPSLAPTVDPKKETKIPPLPVAEKFTKKDDTSAPKPLTKPVTSTKKQNITKDEPSKASLVLQDSKFKNRTPVVVGRVPAPQNKTDNPKKATTATITTVSTTPTTRKKPISVSPTSPTKYVPEIVPTTSLVVSSDPIGATENKTTTEASTSKRTRRPGTKKKKKNKNRRKRPTKTDSDSAESKIQETSVASNKIGSKNPISTSIYNYLAREVMPSVGVGIVGLVLTAGLAGLFLYPFGGGIARRNYNVKGTGPMHDHHNMYYYNSYAPHSEKEPSNAQPEEKVFGQVLTSMSQSAFSSPYDSTKYTTSSNKYRYDMHDFENVNGYAGVNEYSTLPESVKNGEYDPTNDYSSHEKSKEDSYTSALTASQESAKNDYAASEIKSSDYLPESSKYYSMDPVSSHYKLTASSPNVDKYSTFTEYTSYTNPAAVGTSYQPENKTDAISEDKSDKSQPQFSALVGSPQFTNTDFVGSVSLTGSYGTQEVHHRTGALASDHGPRSLKHETKNRKRRDVHDDFSNEIYSNDKSTKSPPSSTESEPSTKESITSENPTEIPQTIEPETTLNPVSSTEKTKQDELTEPPVTDNHNSGGILGFISRLAQLKLQMGINILKSTGEAFQRYLNTMAKRMETAIRTVEKRRMSYQTWLKHENKREKRSVYHRRIHKRFKLH